MAVSESFAFGVGRNRLQSTQCLMKQLLSLSFLLEQ